MEIRDLTLDGYGSHLPQTGVGVFHAPEALAVVDEYTEGDLRLLAGFRGQEPVGLWPVFVRERWPLRLVMSPPPGLSVPRLGPVVMPTSPKRRKRAKLNERFVSGVMEAVDAGAHRTLFGMASHPAYGDPRPYVWSGLRVAPRFSYELDLRDRSSDEVLSSFTKNVRREIRKREELAVTVGAEDASLAARVCHDVERRYGEQGLTYSTPPAFSRDLVESLAEHARVYTARAPNGDFLSGITVLYANDRARFWQGGTKADYRNVSVNALLHWEIIRDILHDPDLESVERYDLGSVNNRRIARYKSNFNPDLTTHYEVKSNLMALAKQAYSVRRHLKGRL